MGQNPNGSYKSVSRSKINACVIILDFYKKKKTNRWHIETLTALVVSHLKQTQNVMIM
jgi:hypothetical protein